jgi:hypothetical protein
VIATTALLAQQGTPVLPPIITASAALLGVIVAQSISYFTRRADEANRRRDQLVDALAAGLGYLSDLDAELRRAERSKSKYWTQAGWQHTTADWPATRRLILTQAMAYPDSGVRNNMNAIVARITEFIQEQGLQASDLKQQLEELQDDLLKMTPK